METTLKKALKTLNITQDKLTHLTGYSKSRIRNISAGAVKIKQEEAELIQEKTGISAIWLQLEVGSMFNKENIGSTETVENLDGSRVNIQYYSDIKPGSKSEYENKKNEIEIISIPKNIINKKIKNCQVDAIRVKSDSMSPTISEDDIAFVRKGYKEIIDNKIYVIKYGSEIKIRRIYKKLNNIVLLRADNNVYPQEEVLLDKNKVVILGQIIFNMASLE